MFRLALDAVRQVMPHLKEVLSDDEFEARAKLALIMQELVDEVREVMKTEAGDIVSQLSPKGGYEDETGVVLSDTGSDSEVEVDWGDGSQYASVLELKVVGHRQDEDEEQEPECDYVWSDGDVVFIRGEENEHGMPETFVVVEMDNSDCTILAKSGSMENWFESYKVRLAEFNIGSTIEVAGEDGQFKITSVGDSTVVAKPVNVDKTLRFYYRDIILVKE